MPPIDAVEDYGSLLGEGLVGVSIVEPLLRRRDERVDLVLSCVSKAGQGLVTVPPDLGSQDRVDISDILPSEISYRVDFLRGHSERGRGTSHGTDAAPDPRLQRP
jgi:hypothetical protein